MEILVRKCTRCDDTLSIVKHSDTDFQGAGYFTRYEVPIGEGDFTETGTVNVDGNEFPLVKWEGETKEVEYWECEKCAENAGR